MLLSPMQKETKHPAPVEQDQAAGAPPAVVTRTPVKSRQELIQELANIKTEYSDRRKKRFIAALRKEVTGQLDKEEKAFPDILKLLRTLKIPYMTFQQWKHTDPAINAAIDEIEEIYVDDCVRIVHDAKVKNPYLAMDILRSRRRAKYGHQVNVNATFTQINFISNVARPKMDPDDIEETRAKIAKKTAFLLGKTEEMTAEQLPDEDQEGESGESPA